ncbi:MAG TPA: hypothetical protein DIT52_02180 [Flavobacteriaceae bacterium]|nr:hypothetical protein [Flavobacteriaceae bacterium]
MFIFFHKIYIILFISILYYKKNSNDTNINYLTSVNESVLCPAIYDPVCGFNGNTYSGSCVAEAQGLLR